MNALVAQARAEVTMTLRRGESLLLAVGIPVAALIAFSSVHIVNTGPGRAVDFLTPGILALAVMSTSMVSLGIATGFERYYGVLKRLGTTPLGRHRLVAAKIAAVVCVEAVQGAVLVATGYGLGWQPRLGAGAVGAAGAFAAWLLACVAFSSLGLAMAGRMPAFAVLGVANGIWFAMLLVSGMVAPLSSLPSGLRTAAKLLPSTALAQCFHSTLGAGASAPGWAWLVLAGWAIGATFLAAVTFRWE